MKACRIFSFLPALLVYAPLTAATVTITDNADGTATLSMAAEGPDNIVCFALDVDVIGGSITAIDIWPPSFNIYPDSIWDEVIIQDGYTYGEGIPSASIIQPGPVPLPSSSFTICACMLNGEATPGADGAAVVEITLTADVPVDICVQENALRGGIVLTTGQGEDITNGTNGIVCFELDPCPDCTTCQYYNLTRLAGGTDDLVNVHDLNALVAYVSQNKIAMLWIVSPPNPNYDPIYNITGNTGGTDSLINVQDLNAIVDYVNNHKTGALWVVNCNSVQ